MNSLDTNQPNQSFFTGLNIPAAVAHDCDSGYCPGYEGYHYRGWSPLLSVYGNTPLNDVATLWTIPNYSVTNKTYEIFHSLWANGVEAGIVRDPNHTSCVNAGGWCTYIYGGIGCAGNAGCLELYGLPGVKPGDNVMIQIEVQGSSSAAYYAINGGPSIWISSKQTDYSGKHFDNYLEPVMAPCLNSSGQPQGGFHASVLSTLWMQWVQYSTGGTPFVFVPGDSAHVSPIHIGNPATHTHYIVKKDTAVSYIRWSLDPTTRNAAGALANQNFPITCSG